jgi:hypothetical protein
VSEVYAICAPYKLQGHFHFSRTERARNGTPGGLKPGSFYTLDAALKRRSPTVLLKLAEGLDHRVVKFGADLLDGLIRAIGPGAVG